MELPLPTLREIVRVIDDCPHEHLRVKDVVVVRGHPSRDGKNASEESDIEEDASVGRDLEVDNKVWVEDGGEKEDGSEGAGDEGDEPGLEKQGEDGSAERSERAYYERMTKEEGKRKRDHTS
jgi:hypothetical protein